MRLKSKSNIDILPDWDAVGWDVSGIFMTQRQATYFNPIGDSRS